MQVSFDQWSINELCFVVFLRHTSFSHSAFLGVWMGARELLGKLDKNAVGEEEGELTPHTGAVVMPLRPFKSPAVWASLSK